MYYSRILKYNTAWKQRDALCVWIRIPTDLKWIQDPIPFLKIFSHKVSTGVLATNRKAIHNSIMEK